MRTIKQTMTIYKKAAEHHILGYRTFRRGWCLCELSARHARKIRACIHTKFDTPEVQAEEVAAIRDLQGFPCTFAQAEFSKETDRAVVKRMIEEVWVQEKKFDTYLLELVGQFVPQAMRQSYSWVRSAGESQQDSLTDPLPDFPHIKEHPTSFNLTLTLFLTVTLSLTLTLITDPNPNFHSNRLGCMWSTRSTAQAVSSRSRMTCRPTH